jgi:hypothetical protein
VVERANAVNQSESMPKVIAYARTGPQVLTLTDFGLERGYVPDQIAEGDITQVLEHVDDGDTLLVDNLEAFNVDKWGGLLLVGGLIKRSVTVVTRMEDLVLKDDLQSTALIAMNCMSIMVRTHPDSNRT